MKIESLQTISAFFVGLVVGGTFVSVVFSDTYQHPIADPTDGEYHVHADFFVYINDRKIDLSDDEFMTTAQQHLGDNTHLHDNNGDIEHIHAENVTFAEFFHSLGFSLTEECLGEPDGTEHCVDSENALHLYVNGEPYTPITEYIPVDDDRLLLYYGNPANERIAEYLEAIPADSCFYSGTCPERGVAPPESCGLTCDL